MKTAVVMLTLPLTLLSLNVFTTLQQTDASVAEPDYDSRHKSIPILRRIADPRFVYTVASTSPLRIEVRSKDIFDQLGYKDLKVDFSKEEVLIIGFMRKLPAGNTLEIADIGLADGNVEFKTTIKPPELGVMYNDTPEYPLVTIVIPKQEGPLPGFQTSLPWNYVCIGNTGNLFLDMDIHLPVMTHEEAVEHLTQSLIMPLLDVSIEEARALAEEHINNPGPRTCRKNWQNPKTFNEEQFRKATNLPITSDYSVFRRADYNDFYDVFTESSSQAHLRIRLPEVRFQRIIKGIATYKVYIAEYGRMSFEIVNLERPLTNEMLREGFQRALSGLVDGEIDKSRFKPVYAYSDSDTMRRY
jgi:hypothetical protein